MQPLPLTQTMREAVLPELERAGMRPATGARPARCRYVITLAVA